MAYDYFYTDSRNRENFIMMPKELFKEERFSNLSLEAKSLYSLMLDRMSLSNKNGMKDEKNRIYIFFTIKEAMELLRVGRNKCVRIFAELCEAGLIEKKRQGLGRASMIYVKNIFPPKSEEVSDEDFKKFQKQTSRSPENKLQEVSKTNSNKTDNNKTENNKTDFSKYHINQYQNISSAEEKIRREKIVSLIKDNIEYDILKERYKKEKLSCIIDITADCITMYTDFFIIGGKRVPSDLVKKRFLSLDSSHIEYVFECMEKTQTEIRNIKSYLISALFNAPLTMDLYYEQKAKEALHEIYGI